MNYLLTILFSFLFVSNFQEMAVTQPSQPMTGPGGMDYVHSEITIHDHGDTEKGYWMYTPKEITGEPLNVVVFIHGYGAMNPMIYGKWIKHIVKRNNVVIFPRYQTRILSPGPDEFAPNAAIAINDAKKELNNLLINANWENVSFVGHSYGGVISADLATNYIKYNIPKAKAVMLCSPGTGPLKGGRLNSYYKMDSDINLIVMVSDNDYVVGDEFGELVFNTATNVINRNLIRQFSDKHGVPKIASDHNQSYCLDEELDSGYRNVTTRRALRISKVDAVDYNGYWKLFDALMDCTFNNKNFEYAFGNTAQQTSLGEWSDGVHIEKLKVFTP